MQHTVYRAISKPIKLIGIDWRLCFGCFGITAVSYIAFRQSLVAAVVTAAVSYAVCYYTTKDDPQYLFLLINKYTKPRILDPLGHTDEPGIHIIHEK